MTRRRSRSGGQLAWVLPAALAMSEAGWAANPAEARDGDPKSAPVVAPAPPAPGVKPASGTAAPVKLDAAAMLYVPPSRGSARHTAGAGTRGIGSGKTRVAVLAPADHVGLTTSASPTLYWHLSEPTTTRIEITVVDDDAIEPVVGLSLPAPVAAGVHALELESLGVVLSPDKTYRWFVALVHDAHRRSKDELAEGSIERIAMPLALESDGNAARAKTAGAEAGGGKPRSPHCAPSRCARPGPASGTTRCPPLRAPSSAIPLIPSCMPTARLCSRRHASLSKSVRRSRRRPARAPLARSRRRPP